MDLGGDLLVALLFLNLPDIFFLVFCFSDQPFVAPFVLNDVVSIVLIRIFRLGSIGVDLNGVSEPARVVPSRLQEATRQWAFLQQLGFITNVGIDSHVLQVSCRILILDRLQEGSIKLSRWL